MTTLYVQSPTLYLSGSGVIIGATTVSLTSLTDIYGNVLTMTNFGDVGYFTCEPDTTNAESGTFTGITANANGTYTLTGVKTILAKSPYTQTSGLVRNHAGGTKVVITDNVGFWDTFVNKNNDSTVVGKLTMPDGANRPVLTADTDTATTTAVITYGQLQRTAIAGATAASTSVLGIVRLSSTPSVATSPIVVETADPRVPTQGENNALVGNNTDIAVGSGNTFVTQTGLQKGAEKYAADAGSTDTYVITLTPVPTSYATGMQVLFRANTVNTGTATLNVNSLGAKTIVKGLNTTLSTGDIPAGQICQVTYDGTNFVLNNPIILEASNGQATIASSTTVTITTGFRPRHITIHSTNGGGGGGAVPATSHGGYDATTGTMWCNYTSFDTNGSVNGSGSSTSYAMNITYGSTPTATTLVINNITDTSFDVVYTKGTAGPLFSWTAIA